MTLLFFRFCVRCSRDWELETSTWQLGKRIEAHFPWELVDDISFGTYSSNSVFTVNKFLPEDECYVMRFLEDFGDRMCCSEGGGRHRVTYDGE